MERFAQYLPSFKTSDFTLSLLGVGNMLPQREGST